MENFFYQRELRNVLVELLATLENQLCDILQIIWSEVIFDEKCLGDLSM